MSQPKCDTMLWEKHLTNQEDKYFILSATGVKKEFGNGGLTLETLGELQAIFKINGNLLLIYFSNK